MAKELERAGIPTVLITALVSLAERQGAPRIVPGRAVPHPTGDPSLPPDGERALRRALIEQALTALQTPVDAPTVFQGA
jgi:glycine reductase